MVIFSEGESPDPIVAPAEHLPKIKRGVSSYSEVRPRANSSHLQPSSGIDLSGNKWRPYSFLEEL